MVKKETAPPNLGEFGSNHLMAIALLNKVSKRHNKVSIRWS